MRSRLNNLSIAVIFFFVYSYIYLAYFYFQHKDLSSSTIVESTFPQSTEKIVRVIDGDTFEIEGGIKVRMIGIDTPEMKNKNKTIDCFATEATKKVESILANKEVVLEKDVSETDKYGRLLRYVYLNGESINDKLVKEGYAKIATFPPDVKHSAMFLESETQARKLNLGLWSACE